jgi:hypothetical protein
MVERRWGCNEVDAERSQRLNGNPTPSKNRIKFLILSPEYQNYSRQPKGLGGPEAQVVVR